MVRRLPAASGGACLKAWLLILATTLLVFIYSPMFRLPNVYKEEIVQLIFATIEAQIRLLCGCRYAHIKTNMTTLVDEVLSFFYSFDVCMCWLEFCLCYVCACMVWTHAYTYCLSLVYSVEGHSQFLPPAIPASPLLLARTLCLSQCVGGVQTQQRTRGEGVSTKRLASAQMLALCSEQRARCANRSLQQVSEISLSHSLARSLALSVCVCVGIRIYVFR